MTAWTPETIAQLKDLHGQGLSGNQIAGQLGRGFTRNSVIGKIHRMGLEPLSKVRSPKARKAILAARARPMKLAKPPAPKKPASTTRHGPVSLSKAGLDGAREDLALPPEPPAPPVVIALRDLGLNQCRFPFGDPKDPGFGFCGKHADGDWCAEHRAIVYTASKPKPVSAGPEVKRTRWPSLGWGRGKGID